KVESDRHDATRQQANPDRPAMKAPAKVANRHSGSSMVIPSMCSLQGKASSACMGSPLNGEAARSPATTLRLNGQNRNRLQRDVLAGALEGVGAPHRPAVAAPHIIGAGA